MINRRLILAGLFIGLCPWPELVWSGERSRSTDLRAATSKVDGDHQHGGVGEPKALRWDYRLLPQWDQFTDASGTPLWQDLVSSEALEPLNSTKPFEFGRTLLGPLPENRGNHFLRHQYKVGEGGYFLGWNRDLLNPESDLAKSAIITRYHPPGADEYSLSGRILWTPKGAPDLNRAWYAVGVEKAGGDVDVLFQRQLQADAKIGEERLLVDLGQEPSLQNVSLAAEDKLVFIAVSSVQNYRYVLINDEELRIKSDALPELREVPVVYQQVLQLLDLSKPKMAEVRQLYEQGDMANAFRIYKDQLIQRIGRFEPIDHFNYWLYVPADADELLNGVLTTKRYGKPEITRAKIGLPGKVDWYRIPDDGYTTLLRDITAMFWVNKLAEKYQSTGDTRYLEAWLGYWADFSQNWPEAYLAARRNPELMAKVEKNSIAWSDIGLYIAWRVETFVQGINAIARTAVQKDQVNAVDDEKLAHLLLHLLTFESPRGVMRIERSHGAPNQRLHLAASMFDLSAYLTDAKEAPQWRRLAVVELERSGYLPDGSDMEQSLNYNTVLIRTIQQMLATSKLIEGAEGEDWYARCNEMLRYRYYFLHAIAKPDGSQPIIGSNNTWRNYRYPTKRLPGLSRPGDFWKKNMDVADEKNVPEERKEAKKPHPSLIQDFSNLPLSARIKAAIVEDRDDFQPGFDSVYFPYGGFAALRDGWKKDDLYLFMKSSRAGAGHMRQGGNGIEVSAYGQAMIVNSGGEMYDPDSPYKGYWISTIAQNSLSVDGYQQDLRHDGEIQKPYEKPIRARYFSSHELDFVEGHYQGKYAGWNFRKHGKDAPKHYQLPESKVVSDVSHSREVLFLKNEKLWIITDRVNSASERDFTLSWLLAPEYTPAQLKQSAQGFETANPERPNLALYQTGSVQPKSTQYYGELSSNRILGWVGLAQDVKAGTFTPALHILNDWRAQGEQQLISVLVPYRTENPVSEFQPTEKGFLLRLQDGKEVSYAVNPEAGTQAVLQTGRYTFTLSPDGGAFSAEKKNQPVTYPSTFSWKDTPKGEVPSYR